MGLVLVSEGYCNKLPQTLGLKTTEMYFLTVLEAGSSKSGCRQVDSPGGPEAEAVVWALAAAGSA